ncbi:MAG: radical SAM protein [bacterium]
MPLLSAELALIEDLIGSEGELVYSREPFSKFLSVSIHLTLRCPHNCAHCYWSRKSKNLPPMTEQQLITIIEKINAQSSITHVSLNGGEPFTQPKLINLALERLNVPYLGILTNGFWATDEHKTDSILRELLKHISSTQTLIIQLSLNRFILNLPGENDPHKVPIENLVKIIKSALNHGCKIRIDLAAFDQLINPDPVLSKLESLLKEQYLPLPRINSNFIEFIGEARNLDPHQFEQRAFEGLKTAYDFIAIFPDGQTTVDNNFFDIINTGNIYKANFDTIKRSINTHPLLYFLFINAYPEHKLLNMVSHFDPTIKNKLKNIISEPTKMRVLFEDPIIKYCLTRLAFLDLVKNGKIAVLDPAKHTMLEKITTEQLLSFLKQKNQIREMQGQTKMWGHPLNCDSLDKSQ